MSLNSINSMNQLQTEDEIENQQNQWYHVQSIIEEFNESCSNDADFEDFFVAMFTMQVLIPNQLSDFENWISANRIKRGYSFSELDEMIYIKDQAVQKMSEQNPCALETPREEEPEATTEPQ